MPVLPLARPLMLGALLVALVSGAAAAQPEAAARPAKPELATKPAKPETAWVSADPEPAQCGRSRRKLWQNGEGWVVKAVTICR